MEKINLNKPEILETTLRDGSYVIDFKFTARETAIIASALEQAGFRIIEIGHGFGLNASKSKGEMPDPDELYIELTKQVTKKAKIGMFFIPGIGRKCDIKMAAEKGLDFIRIGTNVDEIKNGFEYIEYAKKLGLFVSSNFMKTYALSYKEVAKSAKLVKKYGSDIVCVVDSAGSMLPEDVENYFSAIKDETDILLGFHGHNNLGLANINTLRAIECGAKIVDTSLRGMGRSAGNAVTEMVLFILQKKGYNLKIDVKKAMDIADKFIEPFLYEKRIDSISITSGFAQFHSSYLRIIYKYANKYKVDPRDLIINLCQKDKINAPEKLVEELALSLSKEKKTIPKYRISEDILKKTTISEKVDLEYKAQAIAREIQNLSKKYGKKSVFNIVQSVKNSSYVSDFIQKSFSFIIGGCEIETYEQVVKILKNIDGEVEIIFFDGDIKNKESQRIITYTINNVNKSILLFGSNNELWAKSVFSLIEEKLNRNLFSKKILIHSYNRISEILFSFLKDKGVEVYLYDENLIKKEEYYINSLNKLELPIDVIVAFSLNEKKLGIEALELIGNKGLVIDAGIGSIDDNLINKLIKKNIKIMKPDMRPAISSEISFKLGIHTMINEMAGRTKIRGINIVAGGVFGRKGDIVVDSIKKPTQVLGIANGKGGVIYTNWSETDIRKMQKIEKFIIEKGE